MKRLYVETIHNPNYFLSNENTKGADHARHIFRVTKVTNSVTPSIGLTLRIEELDVYCQDDDWNVEVK